MGFILLTSVIAGIVGIILIYTIFSGKMYVYKLAVIFLAVLLIAFMIYIFISLSIMYFILISKSKHRFLSFIAHKILRVYFSIAQTMMKLVKLDTAKLQSSFAEINNAIVHKENVRVKNNEILLLVPHCLQWSYCTRRITTDINNCALCGKCTIKDIKLLAQKYGLMLSVATGGTLARKKVKELKPKAIIAVACERDLSSGILDVDVPVIGVVNERPNGPCFNTFVNVKDIEDAIKFLIK